MIRRPEVFWPAAVLPIVGLTYLLHWGGQLARVENAAAEARAELLAHERDSDIVIVGIDAQSLQALREWPWPRRHHARLLQQLRGAEPASVFLDLDFSSPSTEEDDALLERALGQWEGTPVYLASYFQARSGSDSTPIVTKPLARFAQHAELASVILEPDPDGLVRGMRTSWHVDGEVLRSIFANEAELQAGETVLIDYSIKDSSFGYVSFIDVLNGTVDPAGLRGKEIYVGTIAVELRDTLPVPVYRALAGVVVQALATESVRAGALRALPDWLHFALVALWTAACVALMSKRTWRQNALVVGAGFVLLCAGSLWLYAGPRLVVEIVPLAIILLGVFIAATLRSLDQQTWRALAYSIGLKRRDALLKSVVESSTDSIICVDDQGVIQTANRAASTLLDCPSSTLVRSRLADFIPGLLEHGDGSLDALTAGIVERNVRTATGRTVPAEISMSRVASEGGRLFTAIIRDVSERKAQQRALEHQATHDPLTGLPNRTALTAHLHAVLGKAVPGNRVALLMLDLCRFKEVNDTLGHDVGDEVLREVARRFETRLTPNCFISRIGGDEFTVVVTDVDSRDVIDNLAVGLMGSLKAPLDARGIALEVGVSIGIALSPDHARDAKELLRHADVAMYAAKRQGAAHEYYDRADDQHTVRRLSMLSELRTAIENGGISLHYQPQVSLRTGRAESVEALVRWQHAMHGAIGPAEFVTLAESTDLIRPLTEWTINRALADAAEWSRNGLDLRIAINLSARVLQDVEFPSRLKQALGASKVEAHRLELEITESAMLLDPDRARRIVRDLRALGLQISIDDYGTGFSSLGYLRDLRVHALKLDKSFVIDLETREQNRVIVESTVQMAHALGLRVIAEGVETEWVKSYLQSIGYDVGQGYWFARPMPADECFTWAVEFNAPELKQRAS